MVELIELKLKDIEIKLPESSEAIAQARKLLDLFQETLGEVKPNKYHIVSVKPKSEALTPGTRNVTPIITPLNQPPLNQPSTSEGVSMLPEDVYKFQECEKFDKTVGSKGECKLPASAVEIANPLQEETWKT